MPAVIGAGAETLGFEAPRRVSAAASGAECEWIVPYDVAPDNKAVDKVRVVQLRSDSPLLVPNSDVVHFWEPAMAAAAAAAAAAANAPVGHKKAPPKRKQVSEEPCAAGAGVAAHANSSTSRNDDRVAPTKGVAAAFEVKATAAAAAAAATAAANQIIEAPPQSAAVARVSSSSSADQGAKKMRLEAPAWEQQRAQLSSYIVSLLTTESPEEIEFRESAEVREASRLACLKCDAKLAKFVDSVVLDERNTHAAAAFVSRFEEPLAFVAASLLLRPLVAMRAAALSLAAGIDVPTMPSRVLTLAAQLRARRQHKS